MKNNHRELVEQMAKDGVTRKLNRRDFIQYSVAAGMTVSTASALWSSNVEAAPKKGGTFRIGAHDGNTSDNHNPGQYVSFGTIQLAFSFRSYLTMVLPDNSLGPDLATSWSASADASEWTFELTKDAVFHSGKKFNVDDVIATVNHHRGEDSTSAITALMGGITELVRNNDYSITFKLSAGNADFPWLFTDYHSAVCPANADGTLNWQSGDGSGPYKLVENQFGVGHSLVRHDGWHGEGAYFDALEVTILNDPNARQTALVTDEVDVITQLELKTLALLKRNPNIEIDNIPSAAAITMPMHTNKAPYDNLDVRLALKYACDRQELIDKIAFGAATMGNDVHVGPTMPYYAKLDQRPYDTDKAKFHLKKAGLSNLDVTMVTADMVYSGAVDLAVLYSEAAKPAGINMKVDRRPNDGFWSQVWLVEPFSMVQWGARPTPDQMFTIAYKDDAPWNESYWQNERFNVLLLQAKAELNQDLRTEMYREMQQIAHDDGGTVIPFFPNNVYAHGKKIKHAENVSGAWQLDGGHGSSRWWFA
jgi:peptide/nickel transport system substrate-binding protein